jgi:hypothetical protein
MRIERPLPYLISVVIDSQVGLDHRLHVAMISRQGIFRLGGSEFFGDMSPRFTLGNRIILTHYAGSWRATFVVLPTTLFALTVAVTVSTFKKYH